MIKNIIQIFMALMIAIPAIGQTVQLVDVANAAPGTVTVKVDLLDFTTTNVGSVDLFIEYNENLLTYTGPTSIGFGGQNITINPNYQGNPVIALTWLNATGQTINETFINLEFDYKGGFTTDLVFTGNCEVGSVEGAIIVDLSDDPGAFINGSIILPDPLNQDGTATIGSNTAAAGANATLPISITNDGGFTDAASISLLVGYDTDKLSYVGVSDDVLGFDVAEDGGVISLVLSGTTPLVLPPTDPVINLNFTYLGGGAATVAFQPGSVVTDNEGAILITAFVNGSVSPDIPSGSGTLTIASITSQEGEWVPLPDPPYGQEFVPVPVEVPVTAADLSSPLAGSVMLKFSYDNSKLDYTGYIDALGTAWTVTHTPGYLNFSCSDEVGYTINNGDVLTLKFDYHSGEAHIAFAPGTILNETNGNPIPVGLVDGLVTNPLLVNTKVYLQGPWNSTNMNMNTTLRDNNYIPPSQPYNVAPWNYGGSESVASVVDLPANLVDWILIELRSDETTMVAQRAGFLLNDGSVVDLDGSLLSFEGGLVAGDYYIVIKHRNHLAIMSATAQTFSGASLVYDFTSSQSQSYFDPNIGLPQVKNLGGGFWGMIGGDGDADGKILVSDYFGVWFPFANQLGAYKAGDYNLNSNLLIADIFGIWAPNANLFTHVPN